MGSFPPPLWHDIWPTGSSANAWCNFMQERGWCRSHGAWARWNEQRRPGHGLLGLGHVGLLCQRASGSAPEQGGPTALHDQLSVRDISPTADAQVKRRNGDYSEIVSNIQIGAPGMDIMHQFHHCVWVGDLNYRLDLSDAFGEAAKAKTPPKACQTPIPCIAMLLSPEEAACPPLCRSCSTK